MVSLLGRDKGKDDLLHPEGIRQRRLFNRYISTSGRKGKKERSERGHPKIERTKKVDSQN